MSLEQKRQQISEHRLTEDEIVKFLSKNGLTLEELQMEAFEEKIVEYLSQQRSSRKRGEISTNSSRQSNRQSKIDTTTETSEADVTKDIINTYQDDINRDSNCQFQSNLRGTIDLQFQGNPPRTETDQEQGMDQFLLNLHSSFDYNRNFTCLRSSTNYGEFIKEDEGQIRTLYQNNELIYQGKLNVDNNNLQLQSVKDEEVTKQPLSNETESSQIQPDTIILDHISGINRLNGQDNNQQTDTDYESGLYSGFEGIINILDGIVSTSSQTGSIEQSNTTNLSDQLKKYGNSTITNNSYQPVQNKLSSQQQQHSNSVVQYFQNKLLSESPSTPNQTSMPDQTQRNTQHRGQSLIQIKCKPIEQNSIGKYIEENNGKRPIIKIRKCLVNDKKILYIISNNLPNNPNNQDIQLNTASQIKSSFLNMQSQVETKKQLTSSIIDNHNSIIGNQDSSIVVRSHLDFKRLYKNLKANYYGYFIPPLPKKLTIVQQETFIQKLKLMKDDKKELYNLSQEKLEKLKIQLQQFLECLLNSKVVRNSKMLEDFLTIQDEKIYDTKCDSYQTPPNFNSFESTKTEDFYAQNGIFNYEAVQSLELKDFTKVFSVYNQQAIDKFNLVKKNAAKAQIHLINASQSLGELGDSFSDLQRITEQFNSSNLLGANCFFSQQYKECSILMNNLSQTLLKQHSLISETISIPLKYESMISKQFQHLTNNLQDQLKNYEIKLEKLVAEKQKLYETQNFKEWKLDPKENLTEDIKNNKYKAFKYILPEETAKLKELESKVSFILGVLFQESFIYTKMREIKNTNNFAQFIKQNQRFLNNLQMQQNNCLKKIEDIQKESNQDLFNKMKQGNYYLIQDRTRTLNHQVNQQ